MKTRQIFYFLLLISGISFAQQSYYSDVDLTKTGLELRDALATKVTNTHTNFLSYTPGVWEASKQTDLDPANSSNVLLLYGFEDGTDSDLTNDRFRNKDSNGGNNGDWNREHTYPRSLGNPNLGTEGAGADAHHLRPTDVQRNSNRGSRRFADGTGNSGTTGQGYWYPGDEWKGDVARMMMYMYIRYNNQCLPSNVAVGSTNTVDANMIDLLLEWNAQDPVSAIEDNRNTYHESGAAYAQGNRNPFIDNPYLATLIWGGTVAEDRWGISEPDNENPSIPMNLVISNETGTTIDVSWDAASDNVGVLGYDVYVDGVFNSSTGTTNTTISGLTPETTYSFSVLAKDVAGNTSAQSNAINGTTTTAPTFIINENFDDCNTVSDSFTRVSELSDLNWVCEPTFGQNDTGGYQMNAFSGGSTVPSLDWLITTNPINFDNFENEVLDFYVRSRFGDTQLELLFSADYDGSETPSNFTWTSVPNVTIPLHASGSSSSDETTFSNIDISSITGTVYIAFKYDTNGNDATRWTIDNFQIDGDNDTLGTNNNILEIFNISPNPSKDGTVLINTYNTWNTITIYDINGRLLRKTQNSTSLNSLVIKNLPKGILLIKIDTEQNTVTKKLFVN